MVVTSGPRRLPRSKSRRLHIVGQVSARGLELESLEAQGSQRSGVPWGWTWLSSPMSSSSSLPGNS